MAKFDKELSKKRGDRVKELLREHKMKQIELADKIHVTPEHLNAILNGKRSLTLEHARFIAKLFDVQLEWVMGFSDFKTANDQFCASLDKMEEHAKILHSLIRFVVNSQGFDIEMIDLEKGEKALPVNMEVSESLYYVFKDRDEVIAHLSIEDYSKLRDEIYHYSYYLVEKYRKTQEKLLIKHYKMEKKGGGVSG